MLVLGYAILLFGAMGWAPIRDLERAGGGAATGWDKVMHFAAFAIFGFLLLGWFQSLRPTRGTLGAVVPSLLLGLPYAYFHEWIQTYIPGFYFNPLDAIANFLGLGIGLLLGMLWVLWRAAPGRAAHA